MAHIKVQLTAEEVARALVEYAQRKQGQEPENPWQAFASFKFEDVRIWCETDSNLIILPDLVELDFYDGYPYVEFSLVAGPVTLFQGLRKSQESFSGTPY